MNLCFQMEQLVLRNFANEQLFNEYLITEINRKK